MKRLAPLVGLFIALASPLARSEDGYRLWLRYDPVADPARRAEYQRAAGQLVVQDATATGQAIRAELERGIGGLTGTTVTAAGDLPAGSAGVVVVGTPGGSALVRSLHWDDALTPLGDEGYVIRSAKLGGRSAIVVAARGERGLLYGAFALLRQMQTNRPLADLNVAQSPKLQLRLLNHWDNPNGTIERGYAGRSIWQWGDLPGHVDPRYADYARANASVGINGTVLNNVNAKPEQLRADYLAKTAAIADVLRPYGIRVYLSANFAAPKLIGGLRTADPLDPAVDAWWKAKADEIYRAIPDFGGFLVKANSEGQPGPRDYHRTHADGANCLAAALAPHGGTLVWRCFTYDDSFDKDRAKRAYKEFLPLDGTFAANVFLQVKYGPIDFQPREMFHPLFGKLTKTPIMGEVQITQEDTGHVTHLVYLADTWREFFNADTFARGPGTTIASLLERQPMTGVAGVANVGTDRNWCGHDFAQANWYAFGRMAWDPALSPDAIADEWARQTWGNDATVVSTVTGMMRGSREAMVSYEMPLGLTHIMEGGNHYTAAPARMPDYHRAAADGIGYDRTAAGSNAVAEYAPEVAKRYGHLATCPDELLLWFHHVPWTHKMQSGRTLWDELQHRYTSGVDYVARMGTDWDTLRGRVDDDRFGAVQAKLAKHLRDAGAWRDTCLRYFGDKKDGK